MLREAKHSRSRRTPCPHTAAMAMQGILTTQAAGRTPCGACAAGGSVGVLRLHVSRASRETHSAQDDRFYLTSTVSILVVSFPRMSITFTTTVYLPGSRYSCFTASSNLGFFRVR